jgi:hypothetical protein
MEPERDKLVPAVINGAKTLGGRFRATFADRGRSSMTSSKLRPTATR